MLRLSSSPLSTSSSLFSHLSEQPTPLFRFMYYTINEYAFHYEYASHINIKQNYIIHNYNNIKFKI